MNFIPLISTGLYGAYVVLSGLSVWTTYQHKSPASAWIRGALLLMFLDMTAVLALILANFEYSPSSEEEIIALETSIIVATCIAGLLSDGLLAWRAFVIFGKLFWMKWLLIVVISADCAMGILSNIAYIFGSQSALRADQTSEAAHWLIVAWAWIFFAINTSLTASIMIKIISATNRSTMLNDSHENRSIYRTVIRAIIESSLITWMGLLFYSITSTYDQTITRVNNAFWAVEYAFITLPFTFGISQSLIIARIGLSRLQGPTTASNHTAMMFAGSSGADVGTELVIKGGGLPLETERAIMGSVVTAGRHQTTQSIV